MKHMIKATSNNQGNNDQGVLAMLCSVTFYSMYFVKVQLAGYKIFS